MAVPQFTSQQSEIVINVSENHSSTIFSPQAAAAPLAQTQIERSPSIRASSGEACIPESSAAERVEDSYQDSLRNIVPAQLIEDEEDEEDLYTMSPSAQAKLEKTIAGVKRMEQEQV